MSTDMDDFYAFCVIMATPVQPLLAWTKGEPHPLCIPEQIILLLTQIAQTFINCTQVTPVLAFGHSMCGKSLILDQLIPSDMPVFCGVPIEGISVYPYPVTYKGRTLLLMEASGFDFNDSKSLEAAKKLLFIALSVCGGGLICLETTGMFSKTSAMLDVYQELVNTRQRTDDCKFVVFVESQGRLEKTLKDEYAVFQKGPHAARTSVLIRGSEGMSIECAQSLSERVRTFGSISIPQFLQKLTDLCNVSKFCLTYKDFISVSSPLACANIYNNREALKSGRPLNLFVRDRRNIVVNESALQTLRCSYDLDAPTIVLVVLGEPGLGKSTLLNNLVQYLLRLADPPNVFKTGNTTTHTTLESQVLAAPLRLLNSEYQVMLIDLEGLGGMETSDARVQELQKLLVASIIAISSVQCILIKNEITSLKLLEERLGVLAAYRDEFGLNVEAVNLLFHDKDQKAGENQYLIKYIHDYQEKFGFEAGSIRVINKPSFVSSPKETVDNFLRQLLDSSIYPKKFKGEKMQTLGDILSKLREIVDLKRNILDLEPSDSERQEITNLVIHGASEIADLARTITIADPKASLVREFRDRAAAILARYQQEVAQAPMCVKRLTMEPLQGIVETYVPRFSEIERMHDEIYYFPEIAVIAAAVSMIILGFRHCCFFLSVTSSLSVLYANKAELVRIYPSLSGLCRAIGKRMRNRNLMLILCDLLFVTAIFIFVAAYIKDSMWLAIIGGIIALCAVLFYCPSSSRPSVWQHRSAKSLALVPNRERSSNICLEISDEKVVVVLTVGARKAGKQAFLNAMSSSMSCFSLDNFQTFGEGKGVRSFAFAFVDQDKQVSRGLIIDVQVKKQYTERSRFFHIVAGLLLAHCSRAYFFYLKPKKSESNFLLDHYFPTTTFIEDILRQYKQLRSSDLQPTPAVTVVGSNLEDEDRDNIHRMFADQQLEENLEEVDGNSPRVKELGKQAGGEVTLLAKRDRNRMESAIEVTVNEERSLLVENKKKK